MPLYEKFGVMVPFDPNHQYVTSPFLTPSVLAGIRLLVAVYTLVTLLFILIWDSVKLHNASGFFSYFTELTYIGICSYYWASFVQTAVYARRGGGIAPYPLQDWPRWLQLLHAILGATIVAFPILVTIVYWALLASSSVFQTPFSAWSNISIHLCNTVFSLFEMLFTNSSPPRWIMLPIMIIILGGYLGVAYITHYTQGFYPYAFLDPSKEHSFLAAYIVGIPVAECIIFCVAKGIMTLRQRMVQKYRSPFKDMVELQEAQEAISMKASAPFDGKQVREAV